ADAVPSTVPRRAVCPGEPGPVLPGDSGARSEVRPGRDAEVPGEPGRPRGDGGAAVNRSARCGRLAAVRRTARGERAFLRNAAKRGLALALLLLTGCYQQMGTQPGYRPLQRSDFLPNNRASQPLIPGTVARGQLRTDTHLYEGRDKNGDLVTTFP